MKQYIKKWRKYVLSEQERQSVVLAIFGPSGSGKSYWKTFFRERGWPEIKTNTTRERRKSDINSPEYNFLGREEFNDMLTRDMLINVNPDYQGHAYGTKKEEFLNAGKGIMLTDIDHANDIKAYGAQNNKNVILIYTPAASEKEMSRRLRARGNPERITVASQEAEGEQRAQKMADEVLRDVNDAERIHNMYWSTIDEKVF